MIWDVLIDRKGGEPYPDRIIAAESAERRCSIEKFEKQ